MISLDPEMVRELQAARRSYQGAESVFRWLAGRTNVWEMRIDTVEEKGMERRDAVRFMQKLAEIGVGEFLVGRRGKSTRLEWEISSKAAGDAALLEETGNGFHSGGVENGASEPISDTLTIGRAKELLAHSLGIPIDRIEIIIRA